MKITPTLKLEFDVWVNLTECQARALDALAGYGTDSFLDVFYKHMGKHYLKPHEEGLRSLFESVRDTIANQLDHVDRVKKAIEYSQQETIRENRARAFQKSLEGGK